MYFCHLPASEQTSVFASISDQQFLQAVDSGKERFGKGDVLVVELETIQVLKDRKIQTLWDIRKVVEHKTSVE